MDRSRQEGSPERKKALGQIKSLAATQYLMGAIGLATPLLAYSQRVGSMGGVLKQLDQLMWTGDIGFYMVSAMASGVLVSLFLIGTGAVTNKLSRAARPLTIAHAGLGFANGIYNLIVVFGVLVPALLDFAKIAGPAGIGGAVGGIAGGAIGGFFSLLFPALELWMITRPNVVKLLVGEPLSDEAATA